MSSINFYYQNFVSEETLLGAYRQDDLFPVGNLFDPRTTKVFRTPMGENRAKVFFDVGEDKLADTFLVRLNPLNPIFPQNQISVRGGNNYNPNMLVNPGPNLPRSYFVIRPSSVADFGISFQQLPTNPTFRYWSLNTSPNPDDDSFTEIPKVFLGTKTPGLENIGIDYGWSLEKKSLDKVSINRYGQRFIDKTITKKVLNAGIRLIDQNQLDVFMDMFDCCGNQQSAALGCDRSGRKCD